MLVSSVFASSLEHTIRRDSGCCWVYILRSHFLILSKSPTNENIPHTRLAKLICSCLFAGPASVRFAYCTVPTCDAARQRRPFLKILMLYLPTLLSPFPLPFFARLWISHSSIFVNNPPSLYARLVAADCGRKPRSLCWCVQQGVWRSCFKVVEANKRNEANLGTCCAPHSTTPTHTQHTRMRLEKCTSTHTMHMDTPTHHRPCGVSYFNYSSSIFMCFRFYYFIIIYIIAISLLHSFRPLFCTTSLSMTKSIFTWTRRNGRPWQTLSSIWGGKGCAL